MVLTLVVLREFDAELRARQLFAVKRLTFNAEPGTVCLLIEENHSMTNVQKFNAQAHALMPHFAAELDAAQFEWATAPTMGDISDAIFSAHGEFIGGMAAVIAATTQEK